MTSEPDCEFCPSNSTSSASEEDGEDEPASYIQNEQPQQGIYVPPVKLEPPSNNVHDQPLSKGSSSRDHDTEDSDGLVLDHAFNNKTHKTWPDNHINPIDSKSTAQNKTVSLTSVIPLITKTINVTEKTFVANSTTPFLPVATRIPPAKTEDVPFTNATFTKQNTGQIPTSGAKTEPPAIVPTVPSSPKVNVTIGSVAGSTPVVPHAPLSSSTTTTTHASVKIVEKSTRRSTTKPPSSVPTKSTKTKLKFTSVHGASASPTRNIKHTSASPSVRPNTTSYNHTAKPVDMRQYPSATVPSSPKSSTSKAVYAAPVVIGLLIIVGLLLVVVIFYTRRRARHDNSKEWLKSTFEAKDVLLGKESDIYAQVDLSKKSKKHIVTLPEVIPLVVVIPENDGEQELKPRPNPSPNTTTTTTAAMDHTNELRDDFLVDNVIYEQPASLAEDSEDDEACAAAPSPPPSVSAASQTVSSPPPPMMQLLPASPPDGSKSPYHMPQPAEYLTPSCHQHPPQGPNWRPFHDYDPVYVPTSNAGAMDRRVDSTGYVRRRPHSPPTVPQVYEEINYGAVSAPPLKPRITMGATASGGRSVRAPPPPLPPSGDALSDLTYATSPLQYMADVTVVSSVSTPSEFSTTTNTGIYTTNTLPYGAIQQSADRKHDVEVRSGDMSGGAERFVAPTGGTPNLGASGSGGHSNVIVSQASGPQLSTRISVASSTGSKDEPQYEIVDFQDQDDA